jgi:hypothetical protein
LLHNEIQTECITIVIKNNLYDLYYQKLMKKTLLFSLGLILTLSSLLVSCSEDENISDSKEENISESNGDVLKYEAIDLGLPSGIKWAAYNVGATAPEEYGCYYAWGETEEQSNYDWSTYIHCGGSNSTMTKYCNRTNFGTVDDKAVLDAEDDVAHVKWGGDWRMPTKEEQDELRDNCTWEWTTLNDVAGYRVTGPNGNSIFLPAAGYRVGKDISEKGKNGYYWSSSLFATLCYNAYALRFANTTNAWGSRLRYYGQPVRAVSK